MAMKHPAAKCMHIMASLGTTDTASLAPLEESSFFRVLWCLHHGAKG